MHKELLGVAVATAFVSGCGTVSKPLEPITEDVPANAGHLASSDGMIVKSGSGNCVRSGNWSEQTMIDICERIVREPTPAPVVEKAAEPEPVVATAPAVEQQVIDIEKEPILETVLLNSRALFGLDADKLSDKGSKAMKNLIAKLGDYEAIEKIEIIGHTDSTGSDDYNMQLSEAPGGHNIGFCSRFLQRC